MIDPDLAQKVRSALGPIQVHRVFPLQHPSIRPLALLFPTRVHQGAQERPQVRRVVLKMDTVVRRAPHSRPAHHHADRGLGTKPATQVFLLDRDAPSLQHPDLYISVQHRTVKPLSVPRSEIQHLRLQPPTTRVIGDQLPREPRVHENLGRITRVPQMLRFADRPPGFPYPHERMVRLVSQGLAIAEEDFVVKGYCLHFPPGSPQLTQPTYDSVRDAYLIYARTISPAAIPSRRRCAVLIEMAGQHKVVPIGLPRGG